MEIRIGISGDIVERQELLNGTESVTIEGADDASEWALSGAFSWNLGLIEFAGEGDLTLTRRDGAQLFGTLVGSRVTDAGDADLEAYYAFSTEYDIDGGSGAFADAIGVARANGVLVDRTFQGEWVLTLTTP